MRKRESPKNGCDTGVSVPGAFKLDHWQPVKPILLTKFSNFFTFLLGANSYYPRERKAEKGKMEIFQPERESEISVPGAFKLDHLQPVAHLIFQLFHFYTGGQFLLPQREEG